jgi:hypothetical protein
VRADWKVSSEKGDGKFPLVVRAISGSEVLRVESVSYDTPVAAVVTGVCDGTGARVDTVQLCTGDAAILAHTGRLGDFITMPGTVLDATYPSANAQADNSPARSSDATVELTFIRLRGPAVAAKAMSGREITVVEGVPKTGSRCHHDRDYRFRSLGDFAKRSKIFYVMTSNDDKGTSAGKVMWKLDVRVPAIVYLNFRSDHHVNRTGAAQWLRELQWECCEGMCSTVSTGIPNGPYSGPVFSKVVDGSTVVDLMGSNCSEGTYFVFVEPHEQGPLVEPHEPEPVVEPHEEGPEA